MQPISSPFKQLSRHRGNKWSISVDPSSERLFLSLSGFGPAETALSESSLDRIRTLYMQSLFYCVSVHVACELA